VPETVARRTVPSEAVARDDGAPTEDPTAALAAAAAGWSILVTPSRSGADNMAIDHALMYRAARTGMGVLRIYAWREPTLSFGRHEMANGVYSRAAIQAAGLSVVRRPTGGRAVLHDDEITYSVTAPLAPDGGPNPAPLRARKARARALYAGINYVLRDGLRRLGVAAELAARRPAGTGTTVGAAGPCFDAASEGELVVGGRKLVGSAQWREAGAVLQHGSMLIADHRSRLLALAPALARTVAPPAGLREVLGRVPTPAEVSTALGAALDAALETAGAPRATPLSLDPQTDAMVVALRTRYEDAAWTWRR